MVYFQWNLCHQNATTGISIVYYIKRNFSERTKNFSGEYFYRQTCNLYFAVANVSSGGVVGKIGTSLEYHNSKVESQLEQSFLSYLVFF